MRTSVAREIGIALCARVTWVAAAIGAVVVGHGFVLAVDLYAASSRSALANVLMHREMDPLAGIVRPTLGGAELAVAVLVPIVAARVLAVEKERRTFGTMALAAGSPGAVLRPKLVAAVLASLLVVAPAAILLGTFAALGGHLDAIETGIALGGHVLHAVLLACVAVAAASWTRTSAQATATALVVSLASWAIAAGEGFSALAWMSPLERMSISRVLAPFEQGLVSVGSLAWMAIAIVAAIAAASIGVRFDLSRRARVMALVLLAAATGISFDVSAEAARAYDWTEYRRASLPPGVVAALRAMPEPIAIEVNMDREDSRRRQLERDALAKLRLARPDVVVDAPPTRPDAYGTIVLRVGGQSAETTSTSRKELVTRIFELAGRPVPDFAQVPYPGYPVAWAAARSRFVRVFAYGALPAIVLAIGAVVTRRPSRRRSRGRP